MKKGWRRVLSVILAVLLVGATPATGLKAVVAADGYTYPEPEVLQIDLILHPSRYLQMIHSTEKQKYDAVVCMNEGEPQQIGVQVRGSLSLRKGMELATKRVPMELCFDYANPDGEFRGNPSLKLINCRTPARLLTQLVAMYAFDFLDIPTPTVTPAFIRINDTDFGLYLAVEDLNEAFVQKHFGNVSLYRPISERDDPERIVVFEFTRLLAKVDHGDETLTRYNEAIQCGGNSEAFLDVDEFLRFAACETFLSSDDGFFFRNRNFYLVDNHGKLLLLPWDTDDVFLYHVLGENYSRIDQFEKDYIPLFHQLMQNESYFAKYREYIRKLNDEFLNPETFLTWLEGYIRVLAPFFQRDATISQRSDDVFADLTTGNELYNVYTGNLLLTFQTFHDQLAAQLSGGSDAFSIPDGTVLAPYDVKSEEEDLAYWGNDHSIIFRVCSGYWRLRRQALWQNDGKAMLAIGGGFAFVFACTVLSVYRPTFRRRRKEKYFGGTQI